MNANAKKVDVVRGSGAPMDRHTLWFDDTDKQLKYNDGDGWESSNSSSSSSSGTSSGLPMMRQPTQEELEWFLNSELYSLFTGLYGDNCVIDLILTPASSVFTMPDGEIITCGNINDDLSYSATTEYLYTFYDKIDFNLNRPFHYCNKYEDSQLVDSKIITVKQGPYTLPQSLDLIYWSDRIWWSTSQKLPQGYEIIRSYDEVSGYDICTDYQWYDDEERSPQGNADVYEGSFINRDKIDLNNVQLVTIIKDEYNVLHEISCDIEGAD